MIGKALEPVLAPVGFNWQIDVALIPGMAAREVAVAALGTVYAIEGGKEAVEQIGQTLAEQMEPRDRAGDAGLVRVCAAMRLDTRRSAHAASEEAVINAEADDAGLERDVGADHAGRAAGRLAEIDTEIFEFGRPWSGEGPFDAAAGGPADLGLQFSKPVFGVILMLPKAAPPVRYGSQRSQA